MAKQTYKIGEFRSAYDRVNYINRDFQGHVTYERLRTDLRARYAEALRALSAMIPTLQGRYTDDRVSAMSALGRANAQIERNETAQLEAIENEVDGEIFNPVTKERMTLAARRERQSSTVALTLV